MNWNGLTRYCKENFGLKLLTDDSTIAGVYEKEAIFISSINDNFLRILILTEYVTDRNICKVLEWSSQYMVGGILKDPFNAQYAITHCLSMDISYEEFGDMVSLLMSIAKALKQDLDS